MCGIAGSFGHPALVPPGGPDPAVRRALAHRGPDDFGSWQEHGASLLHWRLAIIDLSSAGHQPMPSGDGRLVLSYNGEIYNFEDLRVEIERRWRELPRHASPAPAQRGWRGRSDTEVVVEGCALWGVDFLSRLNGMFALALYDRLTQTLYLARDRAGVKPLYSWETEGTLLFASEPKLFFRTPSFRPCIDVKGLAAFLRYGHGYGESRVLQGVRQLEPGEVITCVGSPGNRGITLRRARICAPPQWRPVRRSDADAVATIRGLLTKAVERQLVADVPVGILLSGGVDSSVLTALAARTLGPGSTTAFTLGYPGLGPDYDEIDYARRVARHLGVHHHVYEASSKDLVADVERLVWHYDEPFADAAALNVFLLSRFIRSRVTVALAGEGSDELFGGYRRYQYEKAIRALGALGAAASRIARAVRLERAGWLPRRVQVALRALARPTAAERYSSFLESPIPLDVILKPQLLREHGLHPAIHEDCSDRLDGGVVGRLCVLDQRCWLPETYLEKSDKGAMAHGLEIRVPYLDNDVVDFANTLPDDQRIRGRARKWLLRAAFGDLLPDEVFVRFKRGFGVPVSRWLRGELREYFEDRVLAPSSRVAEYLQMGAVERCFREHLRGVRNHSVTLWQCLVLEIWLRQFERRFESGEAARGVAEGRMAP